MAFDGWYSSLDNLKLVRACGWHWPTRHKSDRRVDLAREGPRALSGVAVAAAGTVVWLPGYGPLKVFGIAAPDGGTD